MKVLGVEVIECKKLKDIAADCILVGSEVTPEWAIRLLLKRKSLPKEIYYLAGQIRVKKEQ